MICPLMSYQFDSIRPEVDCKEEKCSWWIAEKRHYTNASEYSIVKQGCAIKRLAEAK